MKHVLVISSVALAACVPSRAAIVRPVDVELERRLGMATDPRLPAAIRELVAKPLELDTARRIAIANNRRLAADLDTLGVAAAGIATATVLAPLEVDLSHKYGLDGSGSETEIDVVQDVLGLILMPRRRGIAQAELRAAQARAVAATVALAADVDLAYYEVVASQQELELRQTAFDAASASAEVAERMHAAGNATDLALERERDLVEQARVDLARAQVAVELRREHFNQVLGLTGGDTRWTVTAHLPDPPDRAPSLDELEQVAVAQNLELVALQRDAEAAAGRVGYARFRAVVPALGVGASAARRDDGGWEAGPALRIALPLFDQQQGPRARANAELSRARNLLAATAVELRASARAARMRVLETHAEAKHLRDVVLPRRQRIVDETLRQYNAMNATTFELLASRRELVDAGRQYIDALRRYWIAVADAEAIRRGVARPSIEPSTAASPDRAPSEH